MIPPYAYWISCKDFTVRVMVDAMTKRIVEAAPIVRKFHGQPLDNLLKWAEKKGGLLVWPEK